MANLQAALMLSQHDQDMSGGCNWMARNPQGRELVWSAINSSVHDLRVFEDDDVLQNLLMLARVGFREVVARLTETDSGDALPVKKLFACPACGGFNEVTLDAPLGSGDVLRCGHCGVQMTLQDDGTPEPPESSPN